ncbi:MAG TPA: transcriptional regulator GcvA [Burkholderiales bacterium]|nr:transcriptional regulator GcvA [Burkholderiales bacterium]
MRNRPYDVPPLDLIEGFEAAARNLSFTRAGAELNLTQSAVSRQIKALEEWLGVPLFERRPRALVLTRDGETLHKAVPGILRAIEDVARKIRHEQQARTLTVTTTASFASLWLIPRLPGYTREHPELDVRISAANKFMDLERSNVEIAIRYTSVMPDGAARKLFEEEVFPVCAPQLLSDPDKPIAMPSDLRHHVLLHYDDPANRILWLDWPTWLESVGLHDFKAAGSVRFNQYEQVVVAAASGQGVALGRSPLLKQMLQDGRLVAPFSDKSVAPRAYYVLTSRVAQNNPDVIEFADWLFREAGQETRSHRRVPTVRRAKQPG